MRHSGTGNRSYPGLSCKGIAAMLVLTLGACDGTHSGSEKKPASTPVIIRGATLETVATSSRPEQLEVAGTVRARTSAVVSTRIPGTIIVLKVREGDRVRKGQLLAQLDAQENQANAAGAHAGIEEARRGLDESQARKRMAEATFERYQKLFNEQAVSRQEFESKQTERDVSVQGAAKSEARLKQAQEGSRAASTIAGYSRIIAPISGIISSKQVDPGATVFPAQPIMIIEDGENYLLELAIPESMANRLQPGAAVQVTIDAVDSPFAAKISDLVPTAVPGSRTFIAKVNLSQKGLKSGMFGRGRISLGNTVNGMRVLKKAIVERGALTTVWVVDKNNIARMRLVKVGTSAGDRVEILAGLSDGERVVVGGVESVSEGSRVE